MSPGPEPVKARLLEGAVTGLAVGAVVVPPPLPALVVVVTAGGAVVVDDPPPATAITGAMGLPEGAAVTMPVATELLG